MKTLRTILFGLLMLVIGLLIASHGSADAFAAAVCSTATPTITPTLPAVLPTASDDQGTRDNPVPLNTKVSMKITDSDKIEYGYDVFISQVITGTKAATMLKDRSSINSPAQDGYEHILVYVNITYTSGPKDKAASISNGNFKTVSEGEILSSAGLLAPDPELFFQGFPGTKVKGWIAAVITSGDTSPVLGLGMSYDGSGGVFFALH